MPIPPALAARLAKRGLMKDASVQGFDPATGRTTAQGCIFSQKNCFLSSPRAKRAGPKGPCAESARAVTGRRCPHSGVG